ncbi:MAG: lytic transglycosylase domain-containing protein [Bacteroidales bacterium]|jgi:hypothetical protein|nr:lytic transglycosylase domain-containing protein [Bacteroidales bacterium]
MINNIKLKNRFYLLLIYITLVEIGCTTAIGSEKEKKQENITANPIRENTIVSPPLPDQITFAGEQVPLNVWWVRERLDHEIIIVAYQHSRTLQTLKRSARMMPTIEKILREEGVPEDFKYLCIAESNLENVVSPAKASGYWQFLEVPGKKYGLVINDEVDERYHLEKATHAACQYLKNSRKLLGSWVLAAAAYNMGDNGVSKAIADQNTKIYWDLALNQETSRYIYRILAYKQLIENPHLYGINVLNSELYHQIPCKEVKVTEPIPDLRVYAQAQGITYLELKVLNPWLRNTKLMKDAELFTLKIPAKSKYNYYDLYE